MVHVSVGFRCGSTETTLGGKGSGAGSSGDDVEVGPRVLFFHAVGGPALTGTCGDC